MTTESPLELNHVIQGASDRPALVILHGLFGSVTNWRGLSRSWAADRRVVSLDLRNHGESPWAETMNYPAMAADVAETLARAGVEEPVVLGHSMGGKTAMALALLDLLPLSALVVADIAPLPYRHDHEEFIDAMEAVDLTGVTRRSEADQQLADRIPTVGIRQFLLQNLVRDDDGYRWRINLAAIRRSMPDLLDWRLQGSRDVPALFVHGADSHYMRDEGRAAAGSHFPAAAFHRVENAGHWLHAEQPAAFQSAVNDFIGRF